MDETAVTSENVNEKAQNVTEEEEPRVRRAVDEKRLCMALKKEVLFKKKAIRSLKAEFDPLCGSVQRIGAERVSDCRRWQWNRENCPPYFVHLFHEFGRCSMHRPYFKFFTWKTILNFAGLLQRVGNSIGGLHQKMQYHGLSINELRALAFEFALIIQTEVPR